MADKKKTTKVQKDSEKADSKSTPMTDDEAKAAVGGGPWGARGLGDRGVIPIPEHLRR